MKKFYKSLSLLALVVLTNGAMAQSTTLTATAVPHVGYTYYMQTDTNTVDRGTFTVSAGSASAQTWNYTPNFANVYNDTTAFVAPGSNPGASAFPMANLSSDQKGGNWVYFKNTSGLMIDGAYITQMGVSVALDFTPDAPQVPVPFTYGNSQNVVYSASTSTTVSGIPVDIRHHANRTIKADAFGTITTPIGTYPNVLRVRTHEVTVDSIIPPAILGPPTVRYDSTINYTWYKNSPDAYVMSIEYDKTGTVSKAKYLQLFLNSIANVSAPTASFNLYPNPASETTTFTYENQATGMVNIQLLDVAGKQVAVLLNEQQAIGKQQVNINLAALHLPKGMYFLRLNSGNSLQTIKLNVN
jgi:hypothetical protein